jgi:hypothetical protein
VSVQWYFNIPYTKGQEEMHQQMKKALMSQGKEYSLDLDYRQMI